MGEQEQERIADIVQEEREAIAAWAESNAAEMRSREPGSDWLQNMRAASISTLEEVARAIRDGAHREERE